MLISIPTTCFNYPCNIHTGNLLTCQKLEFPQLWARGKRLNLPHETQLHLTSKLYFEIIVYDSFFKIVKFAANVSV